MVQIDFKRVKDALPKRAIVNISETPKGNSFIECIVRWPGLYEKGTKAEQNTVDEVFKWQREIIGSENISEFYTEETGSHWYIYLNKKVEFINK